MKIQPGNWMVVRDCCTSGNCVECSGKTKFGTPLRVVHSDNYSREFADYVAKRWGQYHAEVVPMNKA